MYFMNLARIKFLNGINKESLLSIDLLLLSFHKILRIYRITLLDDTCILEKNPSRKVAYSHVEAYPLEQLLI